MADFEVIVTSALPVTVVVEVEAGSLDEVTDEQIEAALEKLADEMNFDGYLAEYIVTQGGGWSSEVVEP